MLCFLEPIRFKILIKLLLFELMFEVFDCENRFLKAEIGNFYVVSTDLKTIFGLKIPSSICNVKKLQITVTVRFLLRFFARNT